MTRFVANRCHTPGQLATRANLAERTLRLLEQGRGNLVRGGPPSTGRGLAAWVTKARREVEMGHTTTVVALLPARPDTAYWHDHVADRATVYFLRGRLRFGGGEQSAPLPSALAVWGARPETLTALDAALVGAWRAG